MDTKIIITCVVLIILVTLQHTLNRILVELREIKQILKRKFN